MHTVAPRPKTLGQSAMWLNTFSEQLASSKSVFLDASLRDAVLAEENAAPRWTCLCSPADVPSCEERSSTGSGLIA